MGHGGEIYLFDMGKPIKILDLAEELIRLSGKKPYDDIEIIFTGLRPGEKLYEELLLDDEGILPTHHEKICIASSVAPDRAELQKDLDTLIAAAKRLDLSSVREVLRKIVPEYTPTQHKQKAQVVLHPSSVVHQ